MSTPSFAQLFQRSSYSRGLSGKNDKQRQSRLEIFVVAAVGFALKHNEVFRRRFFNNFTGVKSGFEKFEPMLQAADCTDLKLENAKIGHKVLVVVEFKVWAGLQPKQDPWSRAFWSKKHNGYGYQLGRDRYNRFETVHYTVVQQDIEPCDKLPFRKSGKLFILKRRSWKSLLPPSSNYENDLVSSLGELGIQELADWRMKTMKIDSKQVKASFEGKAVIEILLRISKELRLSAKSVSEELQCYSEGGFSYLGIGASKKVSRGRDTCGWWWFGYVSEKGRPFQPEVWFYYNAGKKPQLLEKLKLELGNRTEFPKPPESDDCIRTRRRQNSTESDLNWLCRSLGLKLGE